MIRKAWLVVAVCAAAAMMLVIFHGWLQGGLALMPLGMTIC